MSKYNEIKELAEKLEKTKINAIVDKSKEDPDQSSSESEYSDVSEDPEGENETNSDNPPELT